MSSKYNQFDWSRLTLKPLGERVNDLHVEHWLNADQAPIPFAHPGLPKLANRLFTCTSENPQSSSTKVPPTSTTMPLPRLPLPSR